MKEALELKRQQENFIDMTSHGMRNPLSAIIQSADGIVASLHECQTAKTASMPEELVDCIDAAQTIILCAQHQKRIVDDILTLSKLDSHLLLITPVMARPVAVVERALKMSEGESQTNDVKVQFHIAASFYDLKIDWVMLDPSRLLQVIINLTTNAIKFTKTQAKRVITIIVSAALGRPSEGKHQVDYFPTRRSRKDLTLGTEWGTGESLFLHFAVQDTGRGLSTDEKKLLFTRFSQASPRTHVQYGGSGLGLFISRELTELQGGEIGVSSEAGIGSTFAFYIKARRSPPPGDAEADPGLLVNSDSSIGDGGLPPSQRIHKDQPSFSFLSIRGSTASPSARKPDLQEDSSNFNVLLVEDNLVNQKVLEMPVMDGLTCMRKIRQLQEEGSIRGHVPVIVVTANARSEQIAIAVDAGMVSSTAFSSIAVLYTSMSKILATWCPQE